MSPPGCQNRQHNELVCQSTPQPYVVRRAILAGTTIAAEVARLAVPRYGEPSAFSDVSATNPGNLFMLLPPAWVNKPALRDFSGQEIYYRFNHNSFLASAMLAGRRLNFAHCSNLWKL
jgi:hypothetical protein